MRQARLTAKLTRRLAPKAPHTRLGRGLSLIQASGQPFSLPYEPVRTAVHDMAAAPGFRETLRALEKVRFEDGAAITAGKYIANGVYVGASQGLTPGSSKAVVEIEVLPRVTVQGDVSQSGGTGIGLNYKYDY